MDVVPRCRELRRFNYLNYFLFYEIELSEFYEILLPIQLYLAINLELKLILLLWIDRKFNALYILLPFSLLGMVKESKERLWLVRYMVVLLKLELFGIYQVWREKNVLKPAPGKRKCNCRNEVYHRQIGPGMFQQMTEQVLSLVFMQRVPMMAMSLVFLWQTHWHSFFWNVVCLNHCANCYITEPSKNLFCFFQVCEQCQNVKYVREGDFITVDIEKGMQDGQVCFLQNLVWHISYCYMEESLSCIILYLHPCFE